MFKKIYRLGVILLAVLMINILFNIYEQTNFPLYMDVNNIKIDSVASWYPHKSIRTEIKVNEKTKQQLAAIILNNTYKKYDFYGFTGDIEIILIELSYNSNTIKRYSYNVSSNGIIEVQELDTGKSSHYKVKNKSEHIYMLIKRLIS